MMKTKDYLSLSYKMEIGQDLDEGGYVASFPDLPGCVTCADTLEKAIELASDAKREWIAAALDEGIDIPFRTAWKTTPGNSSCAFPAAFTDSWLSTPNAKASA